MNKKLIALIALLTGTLIAGCDTTTNTNTNTNANANTNANVNANATSTATATPNRRSVNANISREEYERDKDTFADDAKRLGRTIGAGANDGWLWTKTRALLATTDDLRDSTINVDVDNAVVSLTGTVATAAQKNKAAQVAKSVEGVKRVDNELKVAANP